MPKDAEYYINKAKVYAKQKSLRKALTAYNKAIALKPELLASFEEPGELAEYCKLVEAVFIYVEGAVEEKKGNFEEAERLYSKAFRKSPLIYTWEEKKPSFNDLKAQVSDLGMMMFCFLPVTEFSIVVDEEAGETIFAGFDLRSSKKVSLKAEIEFNRLNKEGKRLFGGGKYKGALVTFKKLLDLNIREAEARTNIGKAYSEIGEHDSAITQFLIATKLDPNHPSQLHNIAATYFKKEDYKSATHWYEKAIETGHAKPYTYKDKIKAHILLKEYSKAVDTCITVMDMEFDKKFMHLISFKLFRERKFQDIERLLKEVLKRDPGDCDAMAVLGAAYVNLRKFDKARKLYQSILRKDENDLQALIGMAGLSFDEGKFSRTLQLCAQIRKHHRKIPQYMNVQVKALEMNAMLRYPGETKR